MKSTPKNNAKSRFFRQHRDSVLSNNSEGSPGEGSPVYYGDQNSRKTSSMPPSQNTQNQNLPSLIARRKIASQLEGGNMQKFRNGVTIPDKKNQPRVSIQSPAFLNEYKYKRGNNIHSDQKQDDVFNKIFSGGLPEVIRKQVEKAKLGKLNDTMQTEQSDVDDSSFSDENSEDADPVRLATIRKFKKGLYSVYFIGVMLSVRNTIKIVGSLRNSDNPAEKDRGYKKWCWIFPILPTNKFSIYWTIIMALLIILTAILTPFKVSFIEDDNKPFEIIELVFDCGFGVDILINFVSAYYHPRYGLITDFEKIAKNYLSGWFWIDVIAILPFDLIIQGISGDDSSTSSYNKLLRLLRFPRLYRLLKILRLFKMVKLFSTNQTFSKVLKKLNLNLGLIKMVKVLINILFLNHLVGCLFFFIARVESFSPDTWVFRYNLLDEDAWSQYIASYYWAFQTLTTVGYGDIAPKTTAERIIAITWMMVGVGFYSFTIGNLSTILAHIDRRSQALKNKLTAFNNFALKVKLPEFLRLKVQRFFEINHKENVFYWIDPAPMLDELPLILKNSMLLHSYYGMIKNISILHNDANFTAHILTNFKMLKLKQREILYRQDDPSQEVYFISKGSVKWVTEDGEGVFSFVEGTHFGEIEVIDGTKRMCFCQASQSTILLVCDKKVFLEAFNKFPLIKQKIIDTANLRKEKFEKAVQNLKDKENEQPQANQDGSQPPPKKKKLLKSTDYFYHVVMKNIKKRRGSLQAPELQAKQALNNGHGSVNTSMIGGTANNSFVQNDGAASSQRAFMAGVASKLAARRTPGQDDTNKSESSPSKTLFSAFAPKPAAGGGSMLQRILALGQQTKSEDPPKIKSSDSDSKTEDKKEQQQQQPENNNASSAGDQSSQSNELLGIHVSKTSPIHSAAMSNRLGSNFIDSDPARSSIQEVDHTEEISPMKAVPTPDFKGKDSGDTKEVKNRNLPKLNVRQNTMPESAVLRMNESKDSNQSPSPSQNRPYNPNDNYIGEGKEELTNQQKEELVKFFVNYSGNYNDLEYLTKLKDGFNIINQLKEQNDQVVNDLALKRATIFENFSSISDRQLEIQQRVDELLKGGFN